MKKQPVSRWITWLCLSVLHISAAADTSRHGQDAHRWLRQLGYSSLHGNPNILSAELDALSRERDRDAAIQQFFPTPSFSMDRADQAARTQLNQRTTIVRLQQPLWSGGRLSAAVEQAEAALRSSRQTTLSQMQFTLEQLIQSVARYRQARQRTAVLNESVQTHRRLLLQVQRRVDEGLSPPSDLTVAESRLFNVLAESATAQSELHIQRLQLQRLVGRPLDASELQTLDTLPLPTVTAMEWASLTDSEVEDIAHRQPRVLKVMADREQIGHRMQILKANRLPQLSLRLDRIQGDVTGTDHLAVISVNTNFGAGLSNAYEIDALALREQALERDAMAEQQEASRRIASLLHDLALQRERSVQFQAARERTRAFLDSTERLYLTGRKAWLEVLNAAREVSATEVAATDALLQFWSNATLLNLLRDGAGAWLTQPIDPTETLHVSH